MKIDDIQSRKTRHSAEKVTTGGTLETSVSVDSRKRTRTKTRAKTTARTRFNFNFFAYSKKTSAFVLKILVNKVHPE